MEAPGGVKLSWSIASLTRGFSGLSSDTPRSDQAVTNRAYQDGKRSVRLLLEAYYEPQFSDRSHGFRKGRGCHTALREIRNTWVGTVWFIEGDISDCFGSLDHRILISILSEKIHDQRFLRLIRHMLKAGYLEDWEYHDTLSGTPQGALCAAAHNAPYAQCRVMRSAGLAGLVGAGSASERCA
jgi:retron-type reverse transcriptase